MKKLFSLIFLVTVSKLNFASDPNFTCDAGTVSDTGWRFVQCVAHHPSQYVPAQANWDYPAGWVAPDVPTVPLKLIMRFDGYTAGLGTILPEGARPDAIMAQTVYGDYPDEKLWTAGDGRIPWDWGGAFFGENTNGERYVATLEAIANSSYRYNIDWGRGLEFQGHCYGGHASMNQALLLPDPSWQKQVSIVHAGTTGLMFATPGGRLSMDANAQYAWAGFDSALADYTLHLDKLKNIYFRVTGSHPFTDDILYNLEFFTQVCNAGKIACYGQWHDSGHMDNDLKAPTWYDQSYQDLYTDNLMDWRLDSMKVIFTHATSNYLSNAPEHLRGHWNLGLGFNSVQKTRPTGCDGNYPVWTDSTDIVVVPIRYIRRTGMGVGLPDQPMTSTFDLTIRPMAFLLHAGDLVSWQVGSQAGQVVADEGQVTVPQITLGSGSAFTGVILTK